MKVKFQHELLVVAIALITIFSIAAIASAQDNVSSLRIYGEDGLSAAFPYTDPEAPFDPMNNESPIKDFVTFNPALMEDDIVVNNIDSKQKVFATQWFVPEYVEPTGMVWLDDFRRCFDRTLDDGTVEEASELLTDDELREISLDEFQKPIKKVVWEPDHNEYTWEDVVTEYTYMFVDKHYEPRAATAMSTSGAYWTTFWFPVADNDDAQIGLDGCDIDGDNEDDMIILKKVGDFNYDGYKDIKISSELMAVGVGESVQFLDHIVEVEGVYYDGEGEIDRVAFYVYYNGNKEPEQIGGLHVVNVEQGILSAGRHTVTLDKPQFYEPWYLEVEATSVGSEKILLTVGRQLYERETFFVDGAEYDVARIYGPEYNSVKYITIRNPVPEHADVSLNDLSVVKEMVDNEEYLPLLPPFNKVHTMVDDINIPHTENCCEYTGYIGSILNSDAPDGEWYEDECILDAYDTVEERKIYDVDPLLIYFTDKDIEPRFHTDLLEILDEDPILSKIEGTEAWKWLHIHTMPDFYKTFVYPELPDADDGTGDFLLTSSFRAENSKKCDYFYEYLCDVDNFVWPQRLMFVYDQETGVEDIYVNEIDTETNGLRVYGEDGIGAAFPYTDPEAPFDPLSSEAPQKDFVTLNPAKIKAGIVVDNKDSHEKVFFRQWFVPEYTEPTGMVWLDEVYGTYIDKHNHYVWEDVINEYTYMFIDKHYQPTAGMATSEGNPDSFKDFMDQDAGLWTYFWFPVSDMDDTQIGLDSFDMNYDGEDDMTYLLGATDFNADGRKDVAIGSEIFAVAVGDRIQFLDHIVEIEGIYYDGEGEIDRVAVEVYYNGNVLPEQIGGLHSLNVEQGILSAGRHTVVMDSPDFYDPWAMQVLGTSVDSSKVLMRVGRLLHTSETFFVDGAEYDVAMIYGPEENNVKYITIRNPLPEHADVSLNDLSVVKKAVYDGEIIPVLPPFNGDHIMIDDIDIPHTLSDEAEAMTCYYGQWYDSSETDDLLWYHDMNIDTPYDTIAERMFEVPATEIYFTGKDYEDRFHTNLLEILREGCGIVGTSADTTPVESYETWKWLHIYTMPDFYKEFVYPDVPNAGGDGDYLLTSSFTAPNTVICDNVEIQPVYPRMMFTYDPTDGTGIYMNGGAVPIAPPTSEMKGDSNGDEVVDILDLAAFAQAYDSVEGDSNYNAIFDFNEDGAIDVIDLAQFAGVYEF
ncbi:dockerin type I domain-containing protein [Methanolobus sp. WCC4]|uniref:dockerin type I domain-containing protein n=1 Tax=Methanolobus sp. WCC4 TaxID=3125784 RepID=UPI0030FBD8A2